MAVVSGQRQTSNVASSQRVIDLHKEIMLLEPNATPITTVLNQIYNGGRRVACRDKKFSWHNDELEARFDAINDATPPVAAGTTWTVDDGTVFAVDDLVKVPRTGEVALVTEISTNDLTVVRGVGDTTAADLVDNDPLYIIGTAASQGSRSQTARSQNPTKVDNYTQIFKTSVNASGTWLSSSNESSPHDWNHQLKKAGIEHRKDIELAMLFGSPADNESGVGGDRSTTGGLLHFLTSNNKDAGGTLTEAEIEEWIRTLTRYGSDRKTVFASPLVISVLSQFAQGKLQTFVGAESFGVRVMEWISPHGVLKLVKHNLLEGAVYGGYAVAVDFDRQNIAYRYLNGDGPGGSRDTKLLTDRQESDRDGKLDELLTECGLQAGLPKTGGLLTGVTG